MRSLQTWSCAVALCGLATSVGLAACAPATRSVARNGAPKLSAADVHFRMMNGNVLSLDELRGKVVLFDFWATYCEPCRELFPKIDALYKKYHARGFEVIAVSIDEDPAGIATFAGDLGVTFPLAHDKSYDALKAPFAVTKLPTEVLVKRDGEVQLRTEGTDDFPKLVEAIDALMR